jgi:murein DD-endopeptidase MepM/ murein hydrolase activator NlpD
MARLVKPKPKADPKPAPKPAPETPPKAPPVKIGSYGNASIDQWDEAFVNASGAVKKKRGVWVDPHFLKAMMDVETGGDGNYPASKCRPADSYDNVPACGPMQIKQRYHHHRCPECDFKTVPGQIELAAHIIGMTMLERGRDEYDALITTYFPGGDVNGTSQKGYVDRVRKLVGIMKDPKQNTEPRPPKPTKKLTEADILNLISSNAPGVYISFPFRGIGNAIYAYGKGHGTTANNQHSGIDIWMPDEQPVRCLWDGEVVCVGSQGSGLWGQSCGYFSDSDGGIGNITILHDAEVKVSGKMRQLKVTYGHMSSSTVRLGQRVSAAQVIGRSGVGGGWPHVHLDTVVNAPELNNPQIWNNGGEYHLLDPIPTIQAAAAGTPIISYATRLPIPQPGEWETGETVTITKEGVPLLQRASKNAQHVDSPWEVGDTFEAVMLVYSEDEKAWYWVSRAGTRVPLSGTKSQLLGDVK